MIVKFHLGATIHGPGLGRTSSKTVHLDPRLNLNYHTLVIMNDCISIPRQLRLWQFAVWWPNVSVHLCMKSSDFQSNFAIKTEARLWFLIWFAQKKIRHHFKSLIIGAWRLYKGHDANKRVHGAAPRYVDLDLTLISDQFDFFSCLYYVQMD